MLRSVFVALTFLVVSTNAIAAECRCEGDTVVTRDSQDGKKLVLRFPATRVTTATNQAFLCSDVPTNVKLAKLWMPDHGHGSRPTLLTAATPTCTVVDRVRFSMVGPWEIQFSFADDDRATFAVNVGAP